MHCLDKAKTLTEDKINSEITQISSATIEHFSYRSICQIGNYIINIQGLIQGYVQKLRTRNAC